MDGFSVLIETRAPEGVTGPSIEDDIYETFVTILEAAAHVVISANEHGWSARVTVDTETALEALVEATHIVRHAVARAGVPDWPQVYGEIAREDVLNEELASRAASRR